MAAGKSLNWKVRAMRSPFCFQSGTVARADLISAGLSLDIRLEPFPPVVDVRPDELVVGFCQIDNSFDQTDDVHDGVSREQDAAGQDAADDRSQGDGQHDASGAAVSEDEFVDADTAEQNAEHAGDDFV